MSYAVQAFLIYNSVSVTRRDDMVEQVCEPTVGDVVKTKFQHPVCEGMVAEIGIPEAIKLKQGLGVYKPLVEGRSIFEGRVHTILSQTTSFTTIETYKCQKEQKG